MRFATMITRSLSYHIWEPIQLPDVMGTDQDPAGGTPIPNVYTSYAHFYLHEMQISFTSKPVSELWNDNRLSGLFDD